MRNIILLLSFLFCFNNAFSQDNKKKLTKFSDEITVFVQEMDGFINVTKNKELSTVFNQFEENIQSEQLDSKSIKQIIAIANTMLGKRLRPNPHFSNFLKAINQFVYQPTAIPKFNDWLNVVDTLIEESTTKRLMLYFIFTNDFLSSGMLRKSRSVSWHCPSTDYTFEVELGHPFLSFYKEFTLSCSAKGSAIYVDSSIRLGRA